MTTKPTKRAITTGDALTEAEAAAYAKAVHKNGNDLPRTGCVACGEALDLEGSTSTHCYLCVEEELSSRAPEDGSAAEAD